MSTPQVKSLARKDFARLFGCEVSEVPDIGGFDWSYARIAGAERDKLIRGLLERIDDGKLSFAGANTERWNVGWSENLGAFRRSNDVRDLEPRYIKPASVLRLDGQFVQPIEPSFERQWYRLFREWLCRSLEPYDHIYEFGCGSGHNVAHLAERYPKKWIVGLDWSPPAVQICEVLRTTGTAPNVEGRVFDFFKPEGRLEPGAAVLTVGALEQTGKGWEPFMRWLILQQPALVINIEPIVELYDPHSLVDYTATKAHIRRNFWTGWPAWAEKHVDVLKLYRANFGSILLEGYSQTWWRPR